MSHDARTRNRAAEKRREQERLSAAAKAKADAAKAELPKVAAPEPVNEFETPERISLVS
jgi:hypothetical protein